MASGESWSCMIEIKLYGGPFDGSVAELDFPVTKLEDGHLPSGPLKFGGMVYEVDGPAGTAQFTSGTLTPEDRRKLEKLTG